MEKPSAQRMMRRMAVSGRCRAGTGRKGANKVSERAKQEIACHAPCSSSAALGSGTNVLSTSSLPKVCPPPLNAPPVLGRGSGGGPPAAARRRRSSTMFRPAGRFELGSWIDRPLSVDDQLTQRGSNTRHRWAHTYAPLLHKSSSRDSLCRYPPRHRRRHRGRGHGVSELGCSR